MAKFHGKIGYSESKEKVTILPDETEEHTGIWIDEISERDYFGDIIRASKQWTQVETPNDNLTLQNRISIVADDFAYENFSAMRYVIWNGVYWKVSSVETQRPRLILSLGGVYNGPTYTAPATP